MTNKICFGVASIFAVDSARCRACPDCDQCLVACYKELVGFGFEKLAARHKMLMDVKRIKVRASKSDVPQGDTFSEQAKEFGAMLEERKVISKGWVDPYLVDAPMDFRVVCEFLRSHRRSTAKKVANRLADVHSYMPNAKQDSIRLASIMIQVLILYEIIKYNDKTNSIVWILK